VKEIILNLEDLRWLSASGILVAEDGTRIKTSLEASGRSAFSNAGASCDHDVGYRGGEEKPLNHGLHDIVYPSQK